jgi:hypothetical protein
MQLEQAESRHPRRELRQVIALNLQEHCSAFRPSLLDIATNEQSSRKSCLVLPYSCPCSSL